MGNTFYQIDQVVLESIGNIDTYIPRLDFYVVVRFLNVKNQIVIKQAQLRAVVDRLGRLKSMGE